MASSEVVSFKKLKMNDVLLESPQKNIRFYYSQIKHKNNPLLIQSPLFKDIHSLSSSEIMFGLDDNDDMYKFLYDFDHHCSKVLIDNSKEWFGKKLSEKQIETMYRSSIYIDASNSAFFTLNIDKNCDIYDENNNVIDVSKIDKSSTKHGYVLLFQPLFLKVLKTSTNVVWVLRQMKIFSVKTIAADPLPKKLLINENEPKEEEDEKSFY